MRYIKPCALVALILAILAAVPTGIALPLLAIAVVVLCVGCLIS